MLRPCGLRLDNNHAVPFRTALRKKIQNTLVQGGEFGVFVNSESQEICICELLMPLQSGSEWPDSLSNPNFIRPELMGGLVQVDLKKRNRVVHIKGSGTQDRIGKNADNTALNHGAGRPPDSRESFEPFLDAVMVNMSGH